MKRTFEQIRYAIVHFRSLDPSARSDRFVNWLIKPGLLGRASRFLFPGLKRRTPSTRFGVARLLPDPPLSSVSSWAEARDLNLEEVTQVLADADIDYVVIEDVSPTRTQVGISAQDRQRLVEAFEQFGEPGLVLAAHPWTDSARVTVGAPDSFAQRLMRRRTERGTGFTACRYRNINGTDHALGLKYGTIVSLWEYSERPGYGASVRTTTPNRWSQSLQTTHATQGPVAPLAFVRSTLSGLQHVETVVEPVDLVILWVDGDDPEWIERRRGRLVESQHGRRSSIAGEMTADRLYRSRDELKYALRSVETWAPFVNHVFLVTDQQRPSWLTDSSGLTVVDHSDIMPPEALPTFNSNAIDTALHRIPGLSEHFLVSNDDMLFFGPTRPEDFFAPGGLPKLFLSKARIPLGDEAATTAAVDAAATRNRSLIAERHGVTITQKFKHIMIPQTRSLRLEAEATFRDAVSATAQNPFRDHSDVSFSHLCLYEGLATGRAVIGTLPYDYISLGSARMAQALRTTRSAAGRLKVLCLNDSDTEVLLDDFGDPIGEIGVDLAGRDAIVADFLEAVLPTPSSWEQTPQKTPNVLNKELTQ